MTKRQIIRLLDEAHSQGRSWRNIQDEIFPSVPFGTLERIWKSRGKYFPRKWLAYFGVKRSAPARRDPASLPVHDRPVTVLAWQLEHREMM